MAAADTGADRPQSPQPPPPQSVEPDTFFRFQSRRSVVHSTRGIVACTNPLAGQAGLAILAAGGNAADAAVAVSAVLAVVDPPMTGVGGDSFALYFDAAGRGSVRGLNASGRTPLAATREIVCQSIGVPVEDDKGTAAATLPHNSVHAVTVPAGAAGWVDAVEQFGSGRVTLAEVLAPAIRLAETGFPVSKLSAHYWQAAEEDLRTRSPPTPAVTISNDDDAGGGHHTLLKPDPSSPHGVRAPREGEIMRNADLAGTLRRLAAQGKAGFYEGPVAEAIVAVSRAAGGLLTLEDLKHHAALPPDIHEALSMPLGSLQPAQPAEDKDDGDKANKDTMPKPPPPSNLRLWEHPPNGQGIVALLAMGILEELERMGKIAPLRSMDHNSATYLHAVVSALRIAFADAGWFVADPEGDGTENEGGGRFDPKSLLHPAYLAKRAALFDPERASSFAPIHGNPEEVRVPRSEMVLESIECLVASKSTAAGSPTTSDTVYLAVTDEQGNGCSFVNSMSDLFGSCLVVPGCGFALPNRAHMFRLGPADHPNVFAGGKRAYNTIIPAIVTEDEKENDGEDKDEKDEKQKGRLHAVFGVMGGFMQPQGHVQVLLNMHAVGMDPQTALDAPRVCVAPDYFWSPDRAAAAVATTTGSGAGGGSTSAEPAPAPAPPPVGQIYAEDGLPAAVIDDLRALGYIVVVVRSFARSLFGRGQVIRAEHDPVTGERVYAAGSDGRGDGHAVPL